MSKRNNLKNLLCEYCNDSTARYYCGDCLTTTYCSGKCQRADWLKHETQCSLIGDIDKSKKKDFEQAYKNVEELINIFSKHIQELVKMKKRDNEDVSYARTKFKDADKALKKLETEYGKDDIKKAKKEAAKLYDKFQDALDQLRFIEQNMKISPLSKPTSSIKESIE